MYGCGEILRLGVNKMLLVFIFVKLATETINLVEKQLGTI